MKSPSVIDRLFTDNSSSSRPRNRRNNRRDRGEVGPQQCIGLPNFLAVVFRKQVVSQQVVARMQDLASECLKIFRVHTPGPSQREGRLPPAPNTQPVLRVPVSGSKPWSPSTFQPWLRPCILVMKSPSVSDRILRTTVVVVGLVRPMQCICSRRLSLYRWSVESGL